MTHTLECTQRKLFISPYEEVLRCPHQCPFSFLPSFQTSHWLEILQALLLSDSQELRHRGTVITANLMQAQRDLAEKLMESEALEILSVMAKGSDNDKEGGDGKKATPKPEARVAQQCLDLALGYGLIQTGDKAGEPRAEA